MLVSIGNQEFCVAVRPQTIFFMQCVTHKPLQPTGRNKFFCLTEDRGPGHPAGGDRIGDLTRDSCREHVFCAVLSHTFIVLPASGHIELLQAIFASWKILSPGSPHGLLPFHILSKPCYVYFRKELYYLSGLKPAQ